MKTSVKTTVIKHKRPKLDWWDVIAWIVYPFWKTGQGLRWLYRKIFFERIRTGDNGIIGPGYRVYHTTKFAWGKVSFFLLLILLIVQLILYIYK